MANRDGFFFSLSVWIELTFLEMPKMSTFPISVYILTRVVASLNVFEPEPSLTF